MDLDVTAEEIARYESGTLLQEAFPRLSPAEAEFFKTGITPEEWAKTFGTAEGDEPELREWIVVWARSATEASEYFRCQAEDDDHAREQCLNAYPGCTIHHCNPA
jgi:hypothetical protein